MAEPDRRYRVLVNLVRADRPKYWTFHCPHCQMKVCEISNSDVVGMGDLIDMSNSELGLVGTRCDGRSPLGVGRCNYWYYFNLGEAPARRV